MTLIRQARSIRRPLQDKVVQRGLRGFGETLGM